MLEKDGKNGYNRNIRKEEDAFCPPLNANHPRATN